MAKRYCRNAGCPNTTETRYCEKCVPKRQEYNRYTKGLSDKYYNENKRDSELANFYTSTQWKEVRNNYILKHPMCQGCGQHKAKVVDHILEIKDGGERYDYNNLQSLCYPCHNRKTANAKLLRKINKNVPKDNNNEDSN